MEEGLGSKDREIREMGVGRASWVGVGVVSSLLNLRSRDSSLGEINIKIVSR